MSDLDTETNAADGTTTFDFLGESWTVPTKRHLSHIRAIKAEIRLGLVPGNDFLAELFLGAEQFETLLEIDPTEEQMVEFGNKLSAALGTGSAENS
jgi:hypothetical protein